MEDQFGKHRVAKIIVTNVLLGRAGGVKGLISMFPVFTELLNVARDRLWLMQADCTEILIGHPALLPIFILDDPPFIRPTFGYIRGEPALIDWGIVGLSDYAGVPPVGYEN